VAAAMSAAQATEIKNMVFIGFTLNQMVNNNIDEVVKSRKVYFSVIPAEAGIRYF
jgi:hypothetical protein